MTSQLKQRIVGATVLLFLAMIILPWLFSNQTPKFEQKISRKKIKIEETYPEILEESEYTSRPVPDKLETPPPVTTNITNSPPQKIDENSVRVTELNSEKITHIENSIVHSTPNPPVSQPSVTKAESKPIKKFKAPNLEKPKPLVKEESKKISAASKEKPWTIQLGSFNNKTNAEKLMHQVREKGFTVYSKTSKTSNGQVTKVFVGHSSEHKAAEILAKKIEKSLHIHGVIVKVNV